MLLSGHLCHHEVSDGFYGFLGVKEVEEKFQRVSEASGDI